jgi:Sel1 repeat-containing protein
VKWLRLAAEQGNAVAQNNLGFMYGNGRGVPRDDAQAVEWYRHSADQRNAFGQAALGWMYMAGRGVPKDPVLAYMWYSLAIKQQPGLEWALKGREKVSAELSPEQIATGEQMAQDWKPSTPPPPLRAARPETPTPPPAQAGTSLLRFWWHAYTPPGANPMTIAKPWNRGPLVGAEACLAEARKQATAFSLPPGPPRADGMVPLLSQPRVLQDGAAVVLYLRPPDGSVGSPVYITRLVCPGSKRC